jgi:2-methylisocitrate lyase-like PEP mutase family enzyme
MSHTAKFRALHHSENLLVLPNPWDIGSAMMFKGLGYQALATTSLGLAFSLGQHEGSLSIEEMMAQAVNIQNITGLPVTVDLENGGADDPEGVAKAISRCVDAGLAGASIEDFTGNMDQPIYEFSLASDRIQAAAEAAHNLDPDFMLTARSENFSYGRPDLDDTINRLHAFEKHGAGVLYAPEVTKLSDLKILCSAVSLPVNVVVGLRTKGFTTQNLTEVGVRRVSLGSTLARAAYGAAIEALQQNLESGSFELGENAMDYASVNQLLKSGSAQ